MTSTSITERRDRALLLLSLIFLACALLLSGARIWLLDATVPAPRPHAVLRLALPGLDVGADAWPAKAHVAGHIQLWIWPHDGDDMQTLFRIEGSPPQPRAPRQRPAPELAPQILAVTQMSPISVAPEPGLAAS